MPWQKSDAGRLMDLFSRYKATWGRAWGTRDQSALAARLPHELAFLPAHLALAERPPHPAPLWCARILLTITASIVALAAIGRLDIVAVAPGQLVPNANIKLIQPALMGVVRRILVQNGERVAAGQLLVELDATQANADADRSLASRIESQLAVACARALLIAQEEIAEPRVALVDGANSARQTDTQRYAEGVIHEYQQRLASLQIALKRKRAELASAKEQVAKYHDTSPMIRQQEADYRELVKEHYVSAHDYLDKQKAAVEHVHDLAAQAIRVKELEAGVEEQRRDIETVVATFRREQWEIINKADQEETQSRDEATKAVARQTLLQLKSPVPGIVQQLNIHTPGGVVTSAQTLMEIVPDDMLEVEARISNRDIGFVTAGQDVIVKLTPFPYTRYGYLAGTITKVSNDAIADRRGGLVFLARIRIPSNRFQVGRKWVNLSPGMEVTAEIKTGTQTVWQYFMNPLIETGMESLRER